MYRYVNQDGVMNPAADIEEQLADAETNQRPSRMIAEPIQLPAPPPVPRKSIAAERARLWTPPVIAALITAVGSFGIEWMTQPQPVTKDDIEEAVRPLRNDIADVKADLKDHAGEHKTEDRLAENRRRVVDDALSRQQQQIDTIRDRR